MNIQISVVKTKKYATSESGDTVEIIERPSGGISVVVADGQSSGRGAKKVSNMVTRKVISLLAEGVRDGAAARAASDFLFAERSGRVSATLNILSVDNHTQTLVVTRNNPSPSLIYTKDKLVIYDEPSQSIGLYRNTRPQILEVPLVPNMVACVYTDGMLHAGKRVGTLIDTPGIFLDRIRKGNFSADQIADELIKKAIDLDQGRPADDISIVVLFVSPFANEDEIRRMSVILPIN